MKIGVQKLTSKLEQLYSTYNRKQYVDPDPLLFLYNYPDVRDREIAGIIASSLAYGRVAMIMQAVSAVLDKMGPDLRGFVMHADPKNLAAMFQNFKYRFATGDHLSALIMGIQAVIADYGSLGACFTMNHAEGTDLSEGLVRIRGRVLQAGGAGHLLADPGKTSACKRSHLFLRWMVRKDQVDPGGWSNVPTAALTCPVDAHMFKIGHLLGFTKRRSADGVCAAQITEGFRRVSPDDPVKYDFCLTRFGIRDGLDMSELKRFLKDDDYHV
ncbi:MAG TPA: TIGR02757 family protein [Desulfobacter sp.]|uniref:TIGR02757 family protein n=1 Tax=Desulfobacter sp. UBA2225 TaxID=1961413 RepID=UPI000E7D3ADE|nr:TIGR02757 family protein [Desulfobacter sp. UBA2225]HAR32734.1 TIGR02757 family protein [Desulfobacter sp.]